MDKRLSFATMNNVKKLILILIVLAVLYYFLVPAKKTKIRNVGNAHTAVVAFGDSLTYGKGASAERNYPAVLERAIGRRVLNLGQNGETAVHAASRIGEVLLEDPYMVLIEFGGNDAMQSVPFEQTVAAMEQMVSDVQAAGAIAVIVDTGGAGLMSRYSKAYQKIAKENGALFVPGILDGIFGKPALMSDQIHPNAQGYSKIAVKIEKHITPYL